MLKGQCHQISSFVHESVWVLALAWPGLGSLDPRKSRLDPEKFGSGSEKIRIRQDTIRIPDLDRTHLKLYR